MMLVRIVILAVVLFIVLWGFLHANRYLARRLETFEGADDGFVPPPPPDIPPPPQGYVEPTVGELLLYALGGLPEEEKALAEVAKNEEPPIALDQKLSSYLNQNPVEYVAPTDSTSDPLRRRSTVVKDRGSDRRVPAFTKAQTDGYMRQVKLPPVSRKPLWQRLKEQKEQKKPYIPKDRKIVPVQKPSVVPPVDNNKLQYALMISELESSSYNDCYIENCEPVQKYQEESCKGFTPECTIQELQSIDNCLYSYTERCSKQELEQCKEHCRRNWMMRSTRSELKQDETMNSNEKLTTEDGSTSLVLRDNGELELYHNQILVWTSGSSASEIGGGKDKGPFTLTMHGNGDLVLKNGLGLEVWHSNSWLDALGGGFMKAPFKTVVADGEFYIKNRLNNVIWKNSAST